MKPPKVIKKLDIPIIDGRIVSDITFATRLADFLGDIQVNDQCGYEELEYLKSVAGKLLTYQLATATDENEKNYFRNLGYEIK